MRALTSMAVESADNRCARLTSAANDSYGPAMATP